MRDGVDPGDHRFRPRVARVVHVWNDFDPGMGPYPPRGALALYTNTVQSTVRQGSWGFHTVRGGFDPGDHQLRPWVVGVVDVCRAF